MAYENELNRFGTNQDNATAYKYAITRQILDAEILDVYESDGLFSKIIDRPAEDAVRKGFVITGITPELSKKVFRVMGRLDFENAFCMAEKLARLFGGSIIVLFVDDGKNIDEPLDLGNVQKIERLEAFGREIVEPNCENVQQAEYFIINSLRYGKFIVHRSRCLIFRNGEAPERAIPQYRGWGIPEYVRIMDELQRCETAHEYAGKVINRTQRVIKIKGLADILRQEDGETKVLERLQSIDKGLNLQNTVVLDTDEEYIFLNIPKGLYTGTAEMVAITDRMLSAVTGIPTRILFGGEIEKNVTNLKQGKSRPVKSKKGGFDSALESYYSMIEGIQALNMKGNLRQLIDLILYQAIFEGRIERVPSYDIRFQSLWSETALDAEKRKLIDAQKELSKAKTHTTLILNGVISPDEVRKSLYKRGYDLKEGR